MPKLFKLAAKRRVGRFCSSLLVFTLVFTDIFLVLDFGLYQAPEAEASVGDFSIFREVTGGEVISSTGNSVTWDTAVSESSNIQLDVNDSDINLSEGGKYLVMYNAYTEEGSTGGGNRRSVASYLTVDGTASEYGWGGGYIRDADNDLTAYNTGAAILDVSAGQDLRVVLDRDDGNPSGGTAIRGGTNGVSVLKLDDTLDFLRIHKSTRSSDISGNTTFTDVDWDTSDEVDTGSFGFTPTSADITLKGDAGKKFLVTTNVKLNVDGAGGPRQNYELRLTLDGSEIEGTRTSSYLRFDNDTFNGTMQYVGIIEKTAAGDQTFNVEVRREGPESASTDIVGDETALAIAALPAGAEVLSLTNSTDQLLTTSQSVMDWDTQISTSSTYFIHSTSSNSHEIELNASGDYLFFATTYTSRTSGGNRDVPKLDWRLNSSVLNYGGHGSFNRGDQSTDDAFTSGASGGTIISGLAPGDVIDLVQSDETGGTPVSNFISNRVALQAVEINTLLAVASTDVTVLGSQPATSSPAVTDLLLDETFVIQENDASRNVTSITLSENGTLDAAVDLSGVRMYYDLDTSLPYDCTSESYSGSEDQYGATSTFSSSNGTITFADSVSISTTQAMCTYLVLDVEASAQDGETFNVYMDDPSVDVVVTAGGTVNPPSSIANVTTVIEDPEITQSGYHWRNDDGSEAGATSATAGVENTPGLSFSSTTPQRLRMGVSVEGTGSETNSYRLEYAEKVSTCDAATGWTDVGDTGGAWDMFDSASLVEGDDTTNIDLADGGVTDAADLFLVTNGGVRDASSQTAAITLASDPVVPIGEFDSVSVTNGSPVTISLDNTYSNPVVVASARYQRTATQRTPRISNKTATSFDVLVDNFDGSLGAGNSTLDYFVIEAGEWTIDGQQVYAGTTSVSVSDGRTLPDDPGGSVVTYPSSFTNPSVLLAVTSVNDSDWTFATAYDGTNVDNPPTTSGFTVFLNDNWDSDGHTQPEDVDFVVFEEGSGTNNAIDFDFTSAGSALISSTPVAQNFGTAYSSAPDVILVNAMTQLGSDGGFAQVDENTAPTASAVTISTDEDGASADRGHAAEDVAVISFASAGTLTSVLAAQKQFTELEYSIQASSSALEGVAYCFRVTDAGTPLRNYDFYPEATLSADVTVSSVGSQITSTDAGDSNVYVGGAFSVLSNSGARTVTSITLTETGTIDASANLSNPRIAYETDNSNPRDCSSESYGGGEATANGTAFSDPNGTTTFAISQGISQTSALCVYVLVDVGSGVSDGETIDFEITSPNSDVVVTTSTVGPGSAIGLTGSTTVNAAELNQSGYHWRNDDGDESGATSATAGVPNTTLLNVFQNSTQRVRMAVANDGGLSLSGSQLRLEYGVKVATCSGVSGWERVDTGVAFNMASTSQLTEGDDTTDIADGVGGVPNPATTFITTNGAEKEDDDQLSALTIDVDEFVEVEYALEVTDQAAFGATYCFRLTNAGTPLETYTNFPEMVIQERQDFFIQRGTETVSGTSTTLVAGVDYTAPSASSSAFIRITNTSMMGAGSDTLGSTRGPDDLSAYIEDPDNIMDSVTIARPTTATDNTRVSWEIVEYVGVEGADNEMIVRDADIVTYGASSLFATGTAASGVSDDKDVVVFITGQHNPAANTSDYNTGLSISSWSAGSDEPVFERGDADSIAAGVSYAVVEFTGANWNVQRAEHTFTAAGVTETESITTVNSPGRTFLHAQKLSGDELFNLDESGHEVWLSSIGAVSFELEGGSTNPSDQRSVAWVIENTQVGDGAMEVYRSSDTISSGNPQPSAFVYGIGGDVVTSNASIWVTNRSSGAGAAHPRALLGARILDESNYEIWKSDEGQNQTFRVAVMQWPVANTSVRQDHYRFYVDNDAVTPTDPWPPGATNLGEDTEMTDLDEPLGVGETVRVRMSLFVNNASLVAGSKSFKLQYARRDTSCAAIGSWDDLDDPGGGGIWRGVNGTPTDGTEVPSTLLTFSSIAGSYEESNPSIPTPNTADIGDYIEYDWNIENNGALQKNSYCFRMVESDGSPLDGYDLYPVVRTSGYTPVIDNWRWYDDETNLTPSTALAAEQVAPSNIPLNEIIKLRVSVGEIEGAAGNSIKFNLEYSEDPDFADGGTLLTPTTTCSGNSLWCYADGAGVDNDTIDTTVLSGVDSCVSGVGDGCGTVNEASGLSSSYDQPAFSTSEHEFTLRHDGARVNAVYYFRLVDATNGVDLLASSSYPSLSTEGATLVFGVSGVDANQTLEGVTTDATTTATTLDFGSLPVNENVEVAQRLSVQTNGTEGYQVFLVFDQGLIDSYGNEITAIPGTNASPATWASQCTGATTGCFGYHAGDNVLFNSSVRFASDDTFAGVEAGPVEVMASNVPSVSDESEVVYRTSITQLQPAGDYTTNVQYIVVPRF